MTVSTTAATANMRRSPGLRWIFFALWLLLPGILIHWSAQRRIPRKRKLGGLTSSATLLLLTWSLLSCGGVSTGGGTTTTEGTPVSYVITVTGTSGSLSHSIAVSLLVE
jgi:hypothetical protein